MVVVGDAHGVGRGRDTLVDWATVFTNDRIYVGGVRMCRERKTVRTLSLSHYGSSILGPRFGVWANGCRAIEHQLELDRDDICDRDVYCIPTGVYRLAIRSTPIG